MRVPTVIVGNGYVTSTSDALERVRMSGVDGVMIGRGIFHNPFLFNSAGTLIAERSMQEKLNLLLRHVELFEEYWKGRKHFRVLKKFFKIYVNGFTGASALRSLLVESDSSEELRCIIKQFVARNDSWPDAGQANTECATNP
jgi:tRNA-dihydrouridine synthase